MTDPVTATAAAATLIPEEFIPLAAKLVTNYLGSGKNSIGGKEEDIKRDLENHLLVSFNKCMNIKTILNDDPVRMLEIYSDQSFIVKNKRIDQYDLIDEIRSSKSFIITGTGGGGKSMFMRYLWFSYFEKSEGKIPFFLELRQINNLHTKDLLNFIYVSILDTNSKITKAQIKKALFSGEFILFFDGFDEANQDISQKLEQEITNLKINNPKLTIIVTSRPHDRFNAWQQFYTAEVAPLSKEQTIELINKTQFNEDAKKNLVDKIKKENLYQTHPSFLSNPLLVYMMILTISQNPKIPDQMSQFYEQAYDALFHRHDKSKAGFTRTYKCSLDKRRFTKIFSYFCLSSYLKEKLEFSREELEEYIDKSIELSQEKINSQDYITDLISSACLLNEDGSTYQFIHRSFQEYFTAYCITKILSKNIEAFFEECSNRVLDNVLKLSYEMHEELFIERYLNPIFDKHKDIFEDEENAISVFSKGKFSFLAKKRTRQKTKDKPYYSIQLLDKGSLSNVFYNIRKLENNVSIEKSPDDFAKQRQRDYDIISQLFKLAKSKNDQLLIKFKGQDVIIKINNKTYKSDKINEAFEKSYMFEYLQTLYINSRQFLLTKKDAYLKNQKIQKSLL